MTLKNPPLSFFGNKARFRDQFIEELEKRYDDTYTYVDLFGGSGFLSYLTKITFPKARVIFNDYDYYINRLLNISSTNHLLRELKKICERNGFGDKQKVNPKTKAEMVNLIQKRFDNNLYVDLLTLCSRILFSGSAFISWDKIKRAYYYNRFGTKEISEDRVIDYLIVLEEIDIRHCDYLELFNEFKDKDKVVFFIDPPYLNTNCQTYQMNWLYTDFLKVLDLLKVKNWFYFTSSNSSIYYLIQWLDNSFNTGILSNASIIERKKRVNNIGKYTDYMIITTNP